MYFGKSSPTMESESRQIEANIQALLRQQNNQVDEYAPGVPFKEVPITQASAPPMHSNDNPVEPTPKCSGVFSKLADIGKECAEPVLSGFLEVHERDGRATDVTYVILLCLTFARFVAGAVKLRSDCDKEQCVAMYLFVKGVLGLIFWTIFLVVRLMPKENERERGLKKNRFEKVYICVDSLFAFGWSILGLVWVFGNYSAMISECPGYVNDWNFHFINLAMILTAADLAVVFVFIIYVLYSTDCCRK
ncbi:hypothetical protein DPMN_180581 [Dreissena polymorpha]|uniref:Uncharacterized protein n=1 Tax=Dreissena polymorpha TaxID=45954 RepID=A0A9D4EJE9_DREPO|nr:hypothetical protein DPMN_180581 [Dreissena polymorpha]